MVCAFVSRVILTFVSLSILTMVIACRTVSLPIPATLSPQTTGRILPDPPIPESAVADVPLFYPTDSSHASIPVSIGKHDTLWFIVDLGAAHGVLWPATRTTLGTAFQATGSSLVKGAGGTIHAERGILNSLRIGGATQHDLTTLVLDVEKDLRLLPTPDHPSAGIVGADVLRNYEVEFDFPARRLRLYTPLSPQVYRALVEQHGFVCTPNLAAGFEATGEVVVAVMVNGHPTYALLDTGAPTTTIGGQLAEQLRLSPTSPGVTPVTRWSGGVGGHVDEYRVPGLHITVGPHELSTHRAQFGQIRMPHVAGVNMKEQPTLFVGLSSMNDRVVFISYSTQQVCFGPRVSESM